MQTIVLIRHIVVALLLLVGQLMTSANAQQRGLDHQHAPLTIRSRPVIERLPLNVIGPTDVVSTDSGRVFVADAAGTAVFRIAADGRVALMADELDGLTRICVSEVGDVFALLNSVGSGRILHITASGHLAEFARTPFPATGLARDRVGNLFTTNSLTGDVVQIDGEEMFSVLTQLSEPADDLVLDSIDNPVVLLRSGKVMSVGLGGDSHVIGYVPETSHRLQMHPDGSVVALGSSIDGSRESLWRLTSAAEDVHSFAMLPQGTSAFAFDRLGNLVLANPDLRAVTRVTSRFQIPCPHCSKSVILVFSTEVPLETSEPLRSF